MNKLLINVKKMDTEKKITLKKKGRKLANKKTIIHLRF